MKRSELFFGAILLPLDFLALIAAGALSYGLRTSSWLEDIRPVAFAVDLPFWGYMQLVVLVAVLIVVIFAGQGLYAMQATRRPLAEVTGIFWGVSMGLLLVVLYTFLSAELFQSRFILLFAYMLALLLVGLERYIIRQLQLLLVRRGIGRHRVVLVGNGKYSRQLSRLFTLQSTLGYTVVGEVDVVRWDALEAVQRNYGIDELIQTDPTLPEEDTLALLDFCDKYKIGYKYIPNLFEAHAARVAYRQLGGVPVMELQRTPLEGWGRVVKRAMDVVGALVGLIVTSPLLLVTALLVKLDSTGPIFFYQTRLGRHKEPFRVYKFRSMYIKYCTGADFGGTTADDVRQQLKKKENQRTGPLFKMKDDPRITRIGRFIRKWRIDELPQFWNVLRGEMSLLGPRPHLPEEVAHYDKHQQRLFTIKPGVSGMAQVNGNAGLSFEQEVNLDIRYIETWSLRLDVILLVKTVILLATDRNAV